MAAPRIHAAGFFFEEPPGVRIPVQPIVKHFLTLSCHLWALNREHECTQMFTLADGFDAGVISLANGVLRQLMSVLTQP